jgi:phospholipase C
LSYADLTRRDLLRAGAAGAALGVSALASESVTARVLSSAAAANCGATLGEIEHIIILMQENRSFDSYFGTFPGVRGFDDMRNRQSFAQRGYSGPGARNGRLLPFHLAGTKPVGQCVTDPNHDWIPQHQSWNNGRNDLFYEVHARPRWNGAAGVDVMGYFRQPDIPYYWALAKAFTLCDAYHCSVIGPTEPNRCYSVSATIDPAGRHGGPCLKTVFDINGLSGDFRWTTMPEQLQARGISWKSYTAALGQFDSPFPAFRQFRTNPTLNRLGIKPTYPNEFIHDLDNDSLPSVSWVQLTFPDSEHAAYPPARGEHAVDGFLRNVWRHPKIWRKTAIIINYDENGGFFDHVPPPTPPPGTKGEFVTVNPLPAAAGGIRGPVGLGFRVPCIVVSPWSRGGLVCSDTFDHTSVLRLIERRFGAEVPNLSSWRRSVTGDLTSAFNFRARPDYTIPQLPKTTPDTSPLVTSGTCSTAAPPPYPVPSSIAMPRQQPGRARRPSGICRSGKTKPHPPHFTG